MYERECRAAVEMLLAGRVDLGSRKAVKRALLRAEAVPLPVLQRAPVYEAFVSHCMARAKMERLERFVRRMRH